MGGEGDSVVAGLLEEIVVADAGLDGGQHSLHSFAGQGVGPFEEGDLFGGDGGPEAVFGIEEEVGGVDDVLVASRETEGVDEVGRGVDLVGLGVGLPAGDSDIAVGVDGGVGEEVGFALGLIGEGEGLVAADFE